MKSSLSGHPLPDLPTGASLFLDVVRLSAALVVAYGHLTQLFFSSGWPDHTVWAINSVTIFFLLSGFVIRYVTVDKPGTMRSYFIDRASRIYSVVLPALVFTFVADTLARHFNPGYYNPFFAPGYNRLLARTVANLTFTSGVWNQDVTFLSNSPSWSLSFECFYYVLYGLFFYLKRYRLALVALALLIAGPAIVFLLPLWIAGCLLFEGYMRLRDRSWAIPALAGLTLLGLALLLLDPPFAAAYAHLYHTVSRFHLRRAGASAYITGLVSFVPLLLGLLLTGKIRVDSRGRTARTIRLLAEATFPLYLFHFPIYVLANALLPLSPSSAASKWSLLFFAFAVSVGLGVLLNRLKFNLRLALRRVLPGGPPATAGAIPAKA